MDSKLCWQASPQDLRLASDTLHVWRADLNPPSATVGRLRLLLSDDERQRAARFHFEKDRHRYIVGRAVLRQILARYLRIPAAQLKFGYTRYGKPYLLSAAEPGTLSFNLSHAQTLALFAFTWDRALGIDLEYRRDLPDLEQIAEQFFSVHERRVLKNLPQDAKKRAFFDCWTRKEAYIKALGEGLSHPLDQFDVSLQAGKPARLLRDAQDSAAAQRWTLFAFEPAAGYTAALAVECLNLPASYFQFSF